MDHFRGSRHNDITSPVYRNGNVGIGTAIPTVPLSFGTSLSNSKIALYDGTINGISMRYGLGVQSYQFRLHLDAPAARFSFLSDEAGSTELMTILGTGNVGIGTATPLATLHVSKAEPVSFLVENTIDGYASLNLKSNGKTWHLSKRTSGEGDKLSLYFHNGADYSSPYLTATTDGNIGIGTTSPQAKLAVNGDIVSKKIKVTLSGWADYVFDKTYRLRTSSEVEQYIQFHHHLPEVPSAAEVERSGVDLGDNQATLLKKIEELTLYMIEQNKKIEKLESKINKLEKIEDKDN